MNPARALRTHRFLFRIALSAANTFAWILIFSYFSHIMGVTEALARTAFLYALAFCVAILVVPYSARLLERGARESMLYASAFAGAAFLILGAFFAGVWGSVYVGGILMFVVSLGMYRALYWIPYAVEIHELSVARMTSALLDVAIALVPAVAGFFIASYPLGVAWVFFTAAFIAIVSGYLLVFLPDIVERFSWGYTETFGHLFSRKYRRTFLRSILEGMQGATLFFLWPIAAFLIVGSSFSLFGLVLSLTFLFALVLRAPMRALLGRMRMKDAVLLHTAVGASAWIARTLVANPLGIVLVDTYAHTGGSGREGVDILAWEQAADGGSYVDEQTALKEIGLGVGRIVICITAALLALSFTISVAFLVTFIIAAMSAGASMIIARVPRSKVEK